MNCQPLAPAPNSHASHLPLPRARQLLQYTDSYRNATTSQRKVWMLETSFIAGNPKGEHATHYENACTYFPRKTGRTFPDGDPKAIQGKWWWSQVTHTFLSMCNLKLLGYLSVPLHFFFFKIQHLAAIANKNKTRTYTSRGSMGSPN